MFYTIEIEVWHGNDGHSMKTISKEKKFKIFNKEELIEEAVRETDARIINRLNRHAPECEFDILAAYRKYGITFKGTARIHNRLTGRSIVVYNVEWAKYYWNLHLFRFIDDKLHV